MKRLFFCHGVAPPVLLAATVAFVASSNAAPPNTAPENIDKSRASSRCNTFVEDRNLANFEAYLAALTSGDFAKALSYFAQEAVVNAYGSVPFAGTYSATDGSWVALQQQYWVFNADAAQEAPVLYADCDKVILNGPFKRTARASGRALDTRVIEYFSFDAHGKIVRDDLYFADTAAVNAALAAP